MLGNGGGLELLISPRYRPPTLLIVDSEGTRKILQKLIVATQYEVRSTTLQKLIVVSEVRGTTPEKLIAELA